MTLHDNKGIMLCENKRVLKLLKASLLHKVSECAIMPFLLINTARYKRIQDTKNGLQAEKMSLLDLFSSVAQVHVPNFLFLFLTKFHLFNGSEKSWQDKKKRPTGRKNEFF